MDPADKALAESKTPDAFWPLPLLDSLESRDINLIVPWIANCLLEFIGRQGYWAASQLVPEICQTVETNSVAVVDNLLNKYQHERPADKLFAAYIQLLLAKQSLLLDNIVQLRGRALWAVICSCEDECDDKYRRVLLVIDKYREAMARANVG